MDLFQFEIIEKLNTIIKNQKPDLGYVQNTISTLLGVVLGAILTMITQKMGKLKCFVISYSHKYCSDDEYGNVKEIKDDKQPEYININVVIDFQNTTLVNIGIRNIKIEIHYDNKKVFKFNTKDEETRRKGNSGFYMDTLETMNIEANKVIRKKLECVVLTNEVGFFSKINRSYFSYTTVKNHNKRIRLY